jgi:hypothetical protein
MFGCRSATKAFAAKGSSKTPIAKTSKNKSVLDGIDYPEAKGGTVGSGRAGQW